METIEKKFDGMKFFTGMLIERGLTGEKEVAKALNVTLEKGGDFVATLINSGGMDESRYLRFMADYLGLEYLEKIPVDEIDIEIVKKVPITFLKAIYALPLKIEDSRVVIAVADPLDFEGMNELGIIYEKRVVQVLAPRDRIFDGINRIFDRISGLEGTAGDVFSDEDLGTISKEIEESTKDLLDVTDEAPIIKLVNSILTQAVKEKSSDIHIEPFEKFLSVRFRKDGVLREVLKMPRRLQASVSSRIKIMGNLNIAEKRLPQDGRIRRVVAGKEIDVRLSTIPTTFGERLVMRILDRSSVLLDLKELGFTEENFAKFEELIYRPYGIILVTGPTGSGKTTTLYAALLRINTPDKNILTIEDPVEYQIQGIGQMQVNPKIEFTFASGLRSTLRQDPDVILVGEIRDLETAEIAVQASLTGHLVFSTLHTNDAASAFTRLIDMGVEPFLIASSVLAMIAQRLVRVLCIRCREPYVPMQTELNRLGISMILEGDTFFRAKGCEECMFTGYAGRTGIYEILLVDDPIRELVMKSADANTIKRKAIERGMKTLRDDGAIKVRKGITTIEEVMRVTQDEFVE